MSRVDFHLQTYFYCNCEGFKKAFPFGSSCKSTSASYDTALYKVQTTVPMQKAPWWCRGVQGNLSLGSTSSRKS